LNCMQPTIEPFSPKTDEWLAEILHRLRGSGT
jgi:hypothetical protein